METSQPIYLVMPNTETQHVLKVEPESGDEFEVHCRLCTKTFASYMALMNHAKMSHFEAYLTGNPKEWTADDIVTPQPSPKKPVTSPKATLVKNLSSENVSYIIIKTQDPPVEKKRKRPKKEKEEKPKRVELKKEPQAITGPFECQEQSSVGSDGICHQMFFSCCEYSDHQLIEHARPRRRVARCQVCERPLSHLYHGAKDFICENAHCGEGFDTEEELNKHRIDYHIARKRFECTICHKKFSAQGGVIQHMRMHTGDRPYHCTICPKAFTQKSGLEQHLRTHTKVKPFRCVICSKTFVQTVHLKQHMRTHTNVAPFQCVVCAKRFKQSSHLNYHLKNHLSKVGNAARECREIMDQLRSRDDRSSSMDRETILAEQSIQEDGTYDVSETYAYVDSDSSQKVVCEVTESEHYEVDYM